MKFYVFELGRKYIHFASIFEDDMAVEVDQRNFSWVRVGKLDEGFPYLRFLENEDLNNLSVLTKKLIKIVMSDDIAEFVINTDE